MRVRRATIREVVEHRYGDVMTERQKENMVAAVQDVLELAASDEFAIQVWRVAAASIHRETYEGVKK